ncbi:MAG: GNAT family N-acetyltransferase [Balneolales bacterium]|nr:GNAT family N-acetyltransferase [Balneolales bacterium]
MSYTWRIEKIKPENWPLWDAFALEQRDGTLFHSSIWLREQPQTETEIFGLFKGDALMGGAALAVKTRWRQRLVPQPRMTPYYGPVFSDALVQSPQLKEAFNQLLAGVYTSFDAFTFNLPPQAVQTRQLLQKHAAELMPGCSLRSLRTNRISGCAPDELIESYSGTSQRRYIRRAMRNPELRAESTTDFEQVYALSEESFRAAGRAHPFPKNDFIRLAESLHENGLASCLCVRLKDEMIAAYWVPFDRHTAYYIASGLSQKHRSLHAGPYALHLMISFAMEHKLVFDFEGSMNENINRYFTSFGPEVCTYDHYKSVTSSAVRTLNSLRLLRF